MKNHNMVIDKDSFVHHIKDEKPYNQVISSLLEFFCRALCCKYWKILHNMLF